MAFSKANILTTRESSFGAIRLGQVIPVPSGRLDKVSIFLDPVITDTLLAPSIQVVLEVYELSGGLPTGAALASDIKVLSDIPISGFSNFRIETTVPTTVGIVLHTVGGDANNHVAWRYVSVDSGGEEQLISSDDGASWTANPTRKFSYRAYSIVLNAIDSENQEADISAGILKDVVDDTEDEFELADLDRAAIVGDTVAVDFGDFVITLVVDQSGSMTWNDKDGLRFDFLEDFITDIDNALPSGSSAKYSIVKFRGRRIGKLTIEIQGSQEKGLHFDGVRLVRKAGSPPTSITDGVVVFEGLAEKFIDQGAVTALVPGVEYHYAAFSFATFEPGVQYGTSRTDFATYVTPVTAPFGVAGFKAKHFRTDSLGTELEEGDTDFGHRRIDLSWLNPTGFNYSKITLVRRDDRLPDSPTDGTVLLGDVSSSTVSFTDTFGGTYRFINGLTYYYRIFTENSIGVKCIAANALTASALIASTDRPWEQLEPPLDIPPPSFDITAPGAPTVTVIESNGEINLSWVPASSDSKRYRIFFHETRYPIPTDDNGRTYDGELLFDGTATSFTHRLLDNSQPHYYVIIALDEVENASIPVEPESGTPPRPDDEATVFLPPDSVEDFEAELIGTTIELTWKNPKSPAGTGRFFFGDSIKVVSTVDFIDPGSSENFLIYEFIEESRSIAVIEPFVVDPLTAITVAHVPSTSATSISAIVAVTPLISIQNQMSSASVSLHAALRIKNRLTGAIVAEILTNPVTVILNEPFSLEIKNEPQQNVLRRAWVSSPNNDPGLPCEEFLYEDGTIPGVYVQSGESFNTLIEAKFRDQPLTDSLSVRIRLLDKKTGELTTLIKIPETGTAEATLEIEPIEDEVLDRSDEPIGETEQRSLLPLSLPPSNIAGDFILEVTGEFEGYQKTTSIDASYEPIFNIDLNLASFSPDNVDRVEQSAFVYFGPYNAPESEKRPAADFTVTDWSIRALCKGIPPRPLQSEDNVPGLGVKSFTRGGLASKVFWGPGDDVDDEQNYEIKVTAQAEGMTAVGFGMVKLFPPESFGGRKIFLRHVSNFNIDSMFSDGISTSTWEVVARPQDELGSSLDTGESFVNAIVTAGGTVPPEGLEDGRIVTLLAVVDDNSDPNASPPSAEEFASVVDSVRIKTNMTGPNGKSRSAKAKIVNGKATFEISINARVPVPEETISEEELEDNIYYKIYGIKFDKPKSGIAIVLRAMTTVEINGRPLAFFGGGGNLINDAPPCFIELIEPLRLG